MDSKERHNYYKLAYIVIDIVPDVLREVFRNEWNSKYPSTPWNDNDGGISLGRFQSHTVVGSLTRGDKPHYYKLIKTNGDSKTWDTTLLRYALVHSHPIDLINADPIKEPLKVTTCQAVQMLAEIRNKVCHAKSTFTGDIKFIDTFDDIKKEIQNLGASYKSYETQMEDVKRGSISAAVEERLKREIIVEKEKLDAEKRRQNMERLMYFGVLTITVICLVLIYIYFIPPFVAAYFPLHDIPVTFTGRNEEIATAVGSVNNGQRITVLHGPSGIGKRITGLKIGKILLKQWLPFPWMTVAFVTWDGDSNLFTLQKSLLEAFYLFPETNITYCMKQFFTNNLKRHTVIMIDNVADVFQSNEGPNAKDLMSQLLASNKAIQIILIQKKPIQFVDFSVKNIPLMRLSSTESETLLHDLSPALEKADLQFVVDLCKGSPLLINLFNILYKHNSGLLSILPRGEKTHVAQSEDEDVLAVLSSLFHSMTEDIQMFLLSLWYPKTVEAETITRSFPAADDLMSDFVNAGLVKILPGKNQEQKWTSHNLLHTFAQSVCVTSTSGSQVFKTCLKLDHHFQHHHMTLVVQCANKFFQQDVQGNQPVPHVSLNEQDNVKKMFANAKMDENLHAIYFETIIKASTFFLFGIQEDIFSKYVFYEAANIFKKTDIGHFMTVLYLQSDQGDVYFYNHPNPYEKVSVIISEAVDLFGEESHCENIKDRKHFGRCILVRGRIKSLYQTEMKLKGKIMHDTNTGLHLIEKAEDIFENENMKLEMASALSTKGVVLLTMEKYSKALTAHRKAHAILLNLPLNSIFLAASHYNLAYCYYKMAGFNLLDAVFHFNESFTRFSHTLGSHRRTANTIFFHGSALQSLGKYLESMGSLETAFNIQQQVIYLHTDISQAPRDQAELLYMKYMHAQTKQQLFQQLTTTTTPGENSLQASFTAYVLGNCKLCVNDLPGAEQSFKLAQDILSRLCEEVHGLCYFYDSVVKDVTSTLENFKTNEDHQMHDGNDTDKSVWKLCLDILLVFCGAILFVLTVLCLFLLAGNFDFTPELQTF